MVSRWTSKALLPIAALLLIAMVACAGAPASFGPPGTNATNTGQSQSTAPNTSGNPAGVQPTPSPSGTAANPAGLTAVNHIIYMIQENRSFDHYFGQLDEYRQTLGLPAKAVDGLAPEGSPACAQPGDMPNGCMPVNLKNAQYTVTVPAFHLKTMCIENTSDSWYEAHQDFNLFNISSDTPTMDGFAWGAGGDSNYANTVQPGSDKDTDGVRALGFYDWNDLIYHYWLAANFATSDRWFAPGPMETEPNKMYLVAATSVGHAHKPTGSVNGKTIFQELDAANVSWKIYYADQPSDAIINYFQPYASQHSANIVPISQYFTDLQNGTLPSVAMIEPPFGCSSNLSPVCGGGADEHPGIGNNIQQGVALSKTYIDALMDSSSWKDSVFILTFDESGGLFDHVPPPTTGVPNPDGIPPKDLITQTPADPQGDFTRYGFRVPLMVVSPFTKKNYVSHTVTDSTAILRLIEERFSLPNLTKRDAAAMDMSEFFDFTNVPWAKPPSASSRPQQPTNGACYDGLP